MYCLHTVLPVLSGHSKRRPKIGFQDLLSLNAGQKYCRILQESILQYFRPSLSYHLSLRPLFSLFFEWPLKTGFTVITKYLQNYTISQRSCVVYCSQVSEQKRVGDSCDCTSLWDACRCVKRNESRQLWMCVCCYVTPRPRCRIKMLNVTLNRGSYMSAHV